MPIIATEAQDALITAVRTIAGGRRRHPGRLRLARRACAVQGVCDPDELEALAATVRDGRRLHAGRAPTSRLGALRDALEDAVAAALGDVELRSEIELRSTPPGATRAHGVDATRAGGSPAGWRTAVHFGLLVDLPHGTVWTLHTSDGDLVVDAPGDLVVFGPDTASTWRSSASSAPVIICSARTLLRRGGRWNTARTHSA